MNEQKASMYIVAIVAVVAAVALLLLISGSFDFSSDISGQASKAVKGTKVTPTTAFISIHMEPGQIPTTTEWPEEYWDDLSNLIALADEYDVKLTLNFNPQWGMYILADEERLELLRSWEANGHEIALHHHGPHHDNWNGYTNQEEYMTDKKYIGTVEDMMDIMKQLPASGQIVTAGIGEEEDIDPDWPDDVSYETDGGSEGIDDLLSLPTLHDYGGHTVVGLRHVGYTTGTQVSLPEMLKAFTTSKKGEIVGIIFHEHNYVEQPDDVEKLFQFLEKQNIEVKTAQEILEEESK